METPFSLVHIRATMLDVWVLITQDLSKQRVLELNCCHVNSKKSKNVSKALHFFWDSMLHCGLRILNYFF